MKKYRCPKCKSENVWSDAVQNPNTGQLCLQDTMTCQDCWYERDYGFLEEEVQDPPALRETVLLAAYHGLLSDAVLKEKARLFIAAQGADRPAGEVQVMAWQIVRIGYTAGFREAERAYRLGSAMPSSEDPSGTLWTVLG